MYKRHILFTILCALACTVPLLPVTKVRRLHDLTKNIQKNDLVIVYFYQLDDDSKDYAAQKKLQKKVFKTYRDVEKQYDDYVKFLRLNIARNPEFKKYAIDIKLTSFPSFALFLRGALHAQYPVKAKEVSIIRISEFINKYFNDAIKKKREEERERADDSSGSGVSLHIHSGVYPSDYYDRFHYYPRRYGRRRFRRHRFFGRPYLRGGGRMYRRGRMRGRSFGRGRRRGGGGRRWGKS